MTYLSFSIDRAGPYVATSDGVAAGRISRPPIAGARYDTARVPVTVVAQLHRLVPVVGAMRHDARMGLLVNLTWGDSWRRPKQGLGRVIERIQAASAALPKPTGPDDPSVDVYIYVPGAVWQHDKEGFRLGTLSERGRSSLRVMIYVPEELRDEDEAVLYFDTTFESVAQAVETRLRKRRPDWPIETLVHQVRELRPSN